MFAQDSVAQERTQGFDEMRVPKEQTPLQLANAELNAEPSVLPTDGLAPWDADKFGYVQGRFGPYLQPHPHFIAAVVARADHQVSNAVHEQLENKSSLEYENTQSLIKDLTAVRETLRAINGKGGTEEKAIQRLIQQRVLLATKIAGSTQYDRECRMQRHLLAGKDAEELQENEYFQKSGETRDKWARIAAIWSAVAVGVMPEIEIDLYEGVEKLLKQEAIDRGKQLRQPSKPREPGRDIDPKVLRAACV